MLKPISLLLLIVAGTQSAEPKGCPKQNVEIICEKIEIDKIEVVDVLSCTADRSMTSTIPGSVVSSVNHKNGSEVTNLAQIEGLVIANATVKFIPANLGAKFSNLSFLAIVYSGLLSVKKEDFREFGVSLRRIYLGGNKIISIDADLFEYNSKLILIRLFYNPIRYIEPDFFKNLKKLKDISEVDLRTFSGCTSQLFDSKYGEKMATFAWSSEDCMDETAKVDEQKMIQEACIVVVSRKSESWTDKVKQFFGFNQ